MPGSDNDLLARLNALKPSSVSLNAGSPSIDVEASKPQSVEDKLADRLKRLRNESVPLPSTATSINTDRKASSLPSKSPERIGVGNDAIRDWQQQNGNEPSLDDLIAELGESEPDWKLHTDEQDHVQTLLREAKVALPAEAEPESTARNAVDSGEAWKPAGAVGGSDEPSKTEDQLDNEEADEYIKRILAELEVEDKLDGEPEQEPKSVEENGSSHFPALELPSTPKNLQHQIVATDTTNDPPSYEDSELESRFAKLGLDLPSTPTNKPSSSKPKVQASLKPRSSLPTYTDEDVNSWCCICNDDGEIKCIDCDNDIYCANCWNEGHGNGPGQERGHRALSYARPGS